MGVIVAGLEVIQAGFLVAILAATGKSQTRREGSPPSGYEAIVAGGLYAILLLLIVRQRKAVRSISKTYKGLGIYQQPALYT